MEQQGQQVSEMMETLVDWFETIEEVEMTDEQRYRLFEVAHSFATSKNAAIEMGILPEVYDEWLQFDVLEQWSYLSEQVEEEMADPVKAFLDFAIEGEQRLYLQMMKHCMGNMEEQQSA